MNIQSKILLLIAAVIGVSILGYGWMRYDISNKNIAFEKQQAFERQESLKRCEIAAEEDYVSFWDSQCPVAGMDKLSANCTLPRYIALEIEERRQKSLSNCIKLYPSK